MSCAKYASAVLLSLLLVSMSEGADLIIEPSRRTPAANEALVRLIEGAQLHVTADVLDQLVRKPIDENVPVNDVLLGIPLTGRARLTGATKLELVEDAARGVFDILLTGTAVSSTIGDAGKAKIYSRTITRFAARKRIILDERGLTALPATCRATAASTLDDATSSLPGLRGRLARRIGWRRASESLAEADRISARHTEAQLRRQFDAEVSVQLADANKLLRSQVRELASGRKDGNLPLRFRTTAARLCVSGAQAEAPAAQAPGGMDDPRQKVAAVIVIPASAVDLSTVAGFLGTITSGGTSPSLSNLAEQVLPADVAQLLEQQNVLDGSEYGVRFGVDRGQLVLAVHGRD